MKRWALIRIGKFALVFAIIMGWLFSGWPPLPYGYLPPAVDNTEAAVGDVNLGRWTGGAQTQGNLPESWTAPNGLFPTEARNDNSTYTFTDSTATLTLPSTIEADGYLMIGRFEYHDASNGRFNPQCQIVQTGGTGNFAGPPAGGYERNNNNDQAFVSCFAFVDNPSGSATFQFQWKADSDDSDASSGTQDSVFEVVPLYYAEHGIYTSTSASLYGGTSPNQVTGWSVTDESSTAAIELSSNVVTVKGNNKRYFVFSSQFYEGRGGRTQRWFGHEYDNTQDRAAQAYAYYRNSSNDESGNHIFDIIETVTANRTIEVTAYRGDGIANNQGGADADGSTPGVGDHALVVLELNDNAEVFRTKDGTGGQNLDQGEATDVDLNVSRTGDIDFNDSGSFMRTSDTAMNAEQAMDALIGANISGASRTVTSGTRYTGRAHITVNGAEDNDIYHGNYYRGNQGSTDTFGHSANPVGFVALAQNDDVGVSHQEDGDGGDVTTQAGWVGFWGINLDTLPPPSNALPVASGVSIDSGTGSVTLTENTTADVICSGTVTDTNGYADISAVGAFLFRTSTGTSTADDANSKYSKYGDSECVPSGGSGNSETYTCTFAVAYYADATDSGSPNESDDWTCEMWPKDTTATGTPATDTIEVDSLIALDVTASIDYGSLDPDTDSGAVNQTVTITNTGNRDMDPQVSGADMSDGGSNTIPVGSQEYFDSAFIYGSGTDLSTTPATINLTLPQRTAGEITDTLYWGLGVPNGTPEGNYSGTVTLSATAGV